VSLISRSLLPSLLLLAHSLNAQQFGSGKPENAPEYKAPDEKNAGQFLALTIQKLKMGFDPPRPFRVWALGSSYTNMLGDGSFLQDGLTKKFPGCPPITYHKMVGNSVTWQYLVGWARHLAIPDKPDLILIYTIGKPKDLDLLLTEIRRNCTAEIIVPSIHWRMRDAQNWGLSENAVDQDVPTVREICRRHRVEFVENRKHWAQYLQSNKLPLESLLKDAVHQSEYGAGIIHANILAHFKAPDGDFHYSARTRERKIKININFEPGEPFHLPFRGNRVDLIAQRSPEGGLAKIFIDGKPGSDYPAFFASYMEPSSHNATAGKRQPPRDQGPHGITLLQGLVPQDWTIRMSSDKGDYTLSGSITGKDGAGNSSKSFQSNSGQILIDPVFWRHPERNAKGDSFTFKVYRTTLGEISFAGKKEETFRITLANALTNDRHILRIVPDKEKAPMRIQSFEIFEPPLQETDQP